MAGQPATGAVSGAFASKLQIGVRVHASREVTVGAGETVAVALNMMIMLP